MSTTPTKVAEPGSGAAAIGKSVVVKGQLYSREDLYIDGEVDGAIEVQEHRLTVGPNGRVKASVQAREVILRGTVHGDIVAMDRIDIRKDAKVAGDMKTRRILIEDGAFFKGTVDMVGAAPSSQPAVSGSAQASLTPPVAAPASAGKNSAAAAAARK